jgi:hypothetical protein
MESRVGIIHDGILYFPADITVFSSRHKVENKILLHLHHATAYGTWYIAKYCMLKMRIESNDDDDDVTMLIVP